MYVYVYLLLLLFLQQSVLGIISNPRAPSATMRLVAKVDTSIHNLSVTAFRNQHDSSGNVKLQFSYDRSTVKFEVDGTNSQTEPLLYPLLRPYAEPGWHSGLTKDGLPLSSYVVSMMLMPEHTPLEEFARDRQGLCTDPELKLLKWPNQSNTKMLATNRFQLAARLKQYWLVDTFSR